MQIQTQKNGETIPYTIDWTLELPNNATLLTVVWSADPGLTIVGTPSGVGGSVSVAFISMSNAGIGALLFVRCHVTTSVVPTELIRSFQINCVAEHPL